MTKELIGIRVTQEEREALRIVAAKKNTRINKLVLDLLREHTDMAQYMPKAKRQGVNKHEAK